MAKLPSFKRILSENFPDVKWMGRLASPINTFMEEVTRAFNNQITVNENMEGMTKEVLVEGIYPVKFQWTRTKRPESAWIGNIRRVDGQSANITIPFALDWTFNAQGQIEITNIPGLSASSVNKYYVTIIVLAG